MAETLESMFPLVITHNAIFVSKAAVEVESEGCIVSWVECYNADEIGLPERPMSILVVTDLKGNLIRDDKVEKPAKLVAMAYRVKQIRQEYGITTDEEITDPDLISEILERVWQGEWMGQFNYGKIIYYNELADLLSVPKLAIWELIDKLVAQRKAEWIPDSWILQAPTNEGG
jgi:hypothetical protein